MAQKIMRFRQSHFAAMRQVCEEEGLLESTQCRQTEHVDVFYDEEMFESRKRLFEEFKNEMPHEAAQYTVYEAKDAKEVRARKRPHPIVTLTHPKEISLGR